MDWKTLSDLHQIEEIVQESFQKPIVIFKHSTRCAISDMAKGRLDRELAPNGVDFYYLDLISHRNVSNQLSERFAVHHESPQILLIQKGECIYDESHNGIRMDEIAKQLID